MIGDNTNLCSAPGSELTEPACAAKASGYPQEFVVVDHAHGHAIFYVIGKTPWSIEHG